PPPPLRPALVLRHPLPPHLSSFPTRRSSVLRRSPATSACCPTPPSLSRRSRARPTREPSARPCLPPPAGTAPPSCRSRPTTSGRDRKSTRLNSSHVKISYAVFCVKKKNTTHV